MTDHFFIGLTKEYHCPSAPPLTPHLLMPERRRHNRKADGNGAIQALTVGGEAREAPHKGAVGGIRTKSEKPQALANLGFYLCVAEGQSASLARNIIQPHTNNQAESTD